MLKFLIVAAGGAIGSVARYCISGLDYRYSHGVFPFATLVVNLSGSFLIGLFWGAFERLPVSPSIRIFLFVGILGGYTTFSTLALETLNLLRDNEYRIAFLSLILSNFLGLVLVFTGFMLSRYLMGVINFRR